MKGECGGKEVTQVRVETQQRREARLRGPPLGRLRGERRGAGEAVGQEAGGPRGAERRRGGVRRRGLGPGRGPGGRGSASPAGSEVRQRPQDAGRPGGEQGEMTAGVEGRLGGGARTRSPEAGVQGRRHLSGGAPRCRVPDCGGSARLPALPRPRPGGRCPSWRRPLRRSPFRSMARPVTARRLRTREAATPAPAAAQKRAARAPPPVPAPPRGGARLRGEREAYHLLPGRGGSEEWGRGAKEGEGRMWSVCDQEALEEAAPKPDREVCPLW